MDIVEMPSIAAQHVIDAAMVQKDLIVVHAMAEYLDLEPYDKPAYDFLKD